MYSNEDLERFYFRYQAEALPHGTSLQSFCLNNNVPYNIFSKWYKDTRRKVVEVQVQGRPSPRTQNEVESANELDRVEASKVVSTKVASNNVTSKIEEEQASQVRIWLELHLSNGLYLSRKNLSYKQLLHMVEKLEGLC